jgi:hypothetical protein
MRCRGDEEDARLARGAILASAAGFPGPGEEGRRSSNEASGSALCRILPQTSDNSVRAELPAEYTLSEGE